MEAFKRMTEINEGENWGDWFLAREGSRKTVQHKYFTAEKWERVNDENKLLLKEFLSSLKGLDRTEQTILKYENALQIFLIFLLEQSDNKFFIDIKKIDILRFQNWLLNEQKLSPARIRLMKSAVSSWSNFIENYYSEEYKEFRNIVNKIEHPAKAAVREKTFLTQNQIDYLFDKLEKKQDWVKLAILSLAISSGARKAEIFQVTKSCINNKVKDNLYKTNIVRGKGRGKGKFFHLVFGEETANYIRKYLEFRGQDDNELLFVFKDKNGETKPYTAEHLTKWCYGSFSKILGVPVYAHCLRGSRAELLREANVPVDKIKSLLHHESSETTNIYLKPRDEEDIEDIFSI